MFVPQIYRKTKMDISNMLGYIHNIDITVETLLTIDYAYHHEQADYEDGLSFLNRLHKKLSNFFELSWDIEYLKKIIKESEDPSQAFVEVLKEILSEDMIECYGI